MLSGSWVRILGFTFTVAHILLAILSCLIFIRFLATILTLFLTFNSRVAKVEQEEVKAIENDTWKSCPG